MRDQEESKQVDSPETQTTPASAASDNAGEPTELTFQELEERIAPLTGRKDGGGPTVGN